ncbi:DUF4226 domain-containing protein [Nocardia nova]|uniref:DUF4226 domain-containing protein n=1 Tax=Nocardia nova TaxID=37330 RepID=UPI0033C74EB7
MTSAHAEWETESGDVAATVSDDHPEAPPTTPWTRPSRRERDQNRPTAALPPGSAENASAVTDSSRPPGHAAPAAAQVASSPAPSSPWSAARALAPAGQTVPAQSGHDTGLGGRVPTAAPAVSTAAAPARPSPGATLPAQADPGPADPGALDPASSLGPAQSAMTMLPMLASALAGLAGNGNNGSGATRPTADTTGDATLPPEAQQARDALQKLKDTYGDDSKDSAESRSVPRKKQLDTKTGSRTGGGGKTAAQVRRNQLYQRNVAGAFNNLDNDLIDYMRSLDGKHRVDKNAVAQLLREVDIQLARIGPAAYTKAGVQQVHRILIKALLQATRIVTGSTGVSRSGAAEINRLTKQYIYNLAGKQYSKGGSGSGSSQTPATTVGGSVGQWIQQAMKVLQDAGYDTGRMDPDAIAMIIQHESGGNPSATNNWDSNAAKGTPSIGLMQTIGPTFNSHALPGHTNIYDPVDNIVAGVRYAISRYGSVSNVPGVVAVRSGGSYRGY